MSNDSLEVAPSTRHFFFRSWVCRPNYRLQVDLTCLFVLPCTCWRVRTHLVVRAFTGSLAASAPSRWSWASSQVMSTWRCAVSVQDLIQPPLRFHQAGRLVDISRIAYQLSTTPPPSQTMPVGVATNSKWAHPVGIDSTNLIVVRFRAICMESRNMQ